jgi:hypothetical protein
MRMEWGLQEVVTHPLRPGWVDTDHSRPHAVRMTLGDSLYPCLQVTWACMCSTWSL